MGYRGKAGSRSPHRGSSLSVACWLTRWVCPHEIVLVPVEISFWIWWSEHRGQNRRVGEQAVFARVIDPLRVIPVGRDIGVDLLATQLVKNRRLTHGAHTVGAGLRGTASTWCVQTVGGRERRGNPTVRLTTVSNALPERGLNNRFLYLVVATRN